MQYRSFGIFRLLLASLVMLQHFAADLAPARFAALLQPYGMGDMAVLVFFALSGFVITEAAECVYKNRPLAFLTNRALRIMPHFLLAVALSMLAHEIFIGMHGLRLWRSQPTFPAGIAFTVQNVALNFISVLPLTDRVIEYNFLDIAWAVRVETVFYIAIFCGLLLGRLRLAARGLGGILACFALLCAPLFVQSIRHHGAAMFAFMPYFAFGSGWYFAVSHRRWGIVVTAISIPAMLLQYVDYAHSLTALGEVRDAFWSDLAVLVTLLAAFMRLSVAHSPRLRRTDQLLGNFTYPLYLYHEDVLVLILTFTVGYSYSTFVGGLVMSVGVASLMTCLVDPVVNRLRDRVRLGRIRPPLG